jgi:BatD DUF11 like domain
MFRYSILTLLSLTACQVFAQNVVFTATPTANRIGAKDAVQIQYTVKDAQDLVSLEPGRSSDFQVVGGPFQSSSSSFTVVNNRMVQSQSITVTYVLQPKKQGMLSISPGVAKDRAGHTYQSNPVNIEVVPGSLAQQRPAQQRQRDPFFDDDDDPFAMMRKMQQQTQRMQQMMQQRMRQPQQVQPQGQPDKEVSQADIDKDLFIRVFVDKSKVHVGEQITTSYKLYSRIPMQVAISKLPSLNGFWTQDFDIPRQAKPTEETINGKKYQVFLLKKSALFPQQTGSLELDPAEAEGVARIVQQVNPFGNGTLMMNDPFFNSSFFNTVAYRDVKVHLKSLPVKIDVLPDPEKGKPADFTGAVGDFTASAHIDKQEMTTDDVATVTLKITGAGNLKLIQAPQLNLPNGLTTYDPQMVDTITGRSTTISGSKIITYAITPQTPGDYTIPSIPFSYFNPQTGQYQTQQTGPIVLHVKAGKHFTPAVARNGSLLKDIHANDTRQLAKLSTMHTPLLLTGTYWSMYAVPFFAFVGLLVYRRREDELLKNTALLRNKRANKVALQRLNTAKKLLQAGQTKQFYEEVSKAIWLYLGDKLNIPLSTMSKDAATEAISGRNVPAPLQQQLADVMWDCETALYATGGSNKMQRTYEQAVNVISELEDHFKS